MSNIHLACETIIQAPAEEVWAILADYSRDTEWRAGVIAMAPTPPGPVGPGTITHEELRFSGKSYDNTGEVIEVDPGRFFSWRTTSGADANGSRTILPLDEDRCSVRLELNIRPAGAERFFAPVLRWMLGRHLRGDLERLRHLIERATATAASPGVSATWPHA